MMQSIRNHFGNSYILAKDRNDKISEMLKLIKDALLIITFASYL